MLSNTTKLKGLYTYGNELIQPEGSLVVADNVNMDEPNTITPRRGFEDFGQDEFSLERVKQMMSYKKSPLRHIEDRIEFFKDDMFVPFSGSFHQVDEDIRIKFAEANGNFYFTSKTGIKKISVKSADDFNQTSIVDAGTPKALGCSGKIQYTDNGFLPPQSKVAYKVLFGRKDVNNNLILGTPSSRFIAINSSKETYTHERTYIEFKLDEDFRAERTTITCSNGNQTHQTTSSNDSILLVNSANNVHKYAFWFNKGSGVAPSIPGVINVEVDISGAGLTAADVATRLYNAATNASLNDIDVTLSATDVIFTNTKSGSSDGVNSPTGDIGNDIGSGWARTVNIQGTDSNYIQKYFIVPTIDASFCFYYGNSETIQDIPTDPSLVGMTFVGIQINNNSNRSFIANVTSQAMRNNLNGYFTVELNNSGLNPIITLTDKVGGDIPDIDQGTISPLVLSLTIVNQGSISEGKNATVEVSFTVPHGVNDTFFYQIYRTPFVTVTEGLTLNDIDPGESAYLVYEAPVNVSAGNVITIEDITPDTFRAAGLPLYNNPSLGTDILQTNDQPPVAKDICNYQTFTFYANTHTFHRTTLDLIGMDSFVSGLSQFIISNENGSSIYTFRGTPVSTTVTCGEKQNTLIHNSTNPNAKIYMHSALNETKYVIYFDDGTASTPDDVDSIPVRVNIADLDPTDNVAERYALVLAELNDFVVTNITNDSFDVTNSENGEADPVTTPNNDPSDIGSGWSFAETSSGSGEDSVNRFVLLSGSPSVSLRIERTARSLVNVINSDPTSPVNASYLSGLNDLPGKILLEARTIEDKEFYSAVKNIDSDAFSPNLPVIPDVGFTAIESDGIRTKLEYVNHSFEDGEDVYIYLPNTSPVIEGKFVVQVVDADHIIINTPYGSGDTTGSFYFYPFQVSDNLTIKNRLYWSKAGQPEAVPSVNYIDIGTRDEPIERILALRDYLFILKTDGIFMLSGYMAPFTVRQLDTESIACPDSAVVLNNQIYMLSTNSVLIINEANPSIISRMIEDKLFEVLNTGFPYRKVGFGVSYDDDRAYLLWLPSAVNDTVATQCFRYNILERTWTRWTKSATCGHVIGTYPKLYIGDGDRAITMVERKNRDRTDYADKDFEIQMSVLDSFINGKYRVSDTSEIEVGDVVTQTQYVSIEEYNRLLLKLDLDSGLTSTDYYETLKCFTSDNIAAKLTALNMKLIEDDTSGTITNHLFSNDDWVILQQTFNDLITQLNNPSAVTSFKDYPKSTRFTTYEYIITEVNKLDNEIKFEYPTSLILGSMRVYKQIKSLVQTSPIHFGNPSSWKQISKGYLLFDQNNFYKMKLEYSTDLSAYFEGHEFKGRGPGFWDYGQWGFNERNYWGGDGNDAPRRVIIPRNKQRCRYISVRFSHNTARDFYKVDGVAHDVREVSARAYK